MGCDWHPLERGCQSYHQQSCYAMAVGSNGTNGPETEDVFIYCLKMDKFQLAMLIYWRMVFSCQGLGMVSGIGLFSQDSGFGRFAGPEGLRGLCNLELFQKNGGLPTLQGH